MPADFEIRSISSSNFEVILSEKQKNMPAIIINPEPSWPAVQDIDIFNTKSLDLLYRNGLIEQPQPGPLVSYGQGYYFLKIDDKTRFVIPKIVTSQSALLFLGFTPETIEEIWAYVHNPMSATTSTEDDTRMVVIEPGVPPPRKRGAEFWNRVQAWLNNRIFDIMMQTQTQTQTSSYLANTPDANAISSSSSSSDLLVKLGMRNDAQIQYYQHNAPPALGGSHRFCLTQVIESDVLAWANKVITRKWNMLATLEFSIFRGGDEIDMSGWAEVVKEFTQKPIASEMAYVSDPTFALPTKILRLKGDL